MYRTQAIILKTIDTNEYDKLLICYTKDFGKLALLAKGIQKPESKLKGHLDVMDLADFIIVPGKKRSYIRSALSLNKFQNIKKNLEKSALAFFMIELLDKGLMPNEKDISLWDLINKYFDYLNFPKITIPADQFLRSFSHNFFSKLGFIMKTSSFSLDYLNRFSLIELGDGLNTLKFIKKVIK